MYELIILSLLMRQPAHGYLIGKVLNNIIGPVARASNGRIYPLLAKLEESGLITAQEEEQEGRPIRTYRITPRGRERFRELMLDTTSNPREYQDLFAFKVTVFPLISPAERIGLIQHYIEYAQAHIAHLERGIAELTEGAIPGEPASLAGVLRHRLEQWHLELSWARFLLRTMGERPPAR
ncbi:MAG: PadR family transcriptional regulator [Bacillota bacterium]